MKTKKIVKSALVVLTLGVVGVESYMIGQQNNEINEQRQQLTGKSVIKLHDGQILRTDRFTMQFYKVGSNGVDYNAIVTPTNAGKVLGQQGQGAKGLELDLIK